MNENEERAYFDQLHSKYNNPEILNPQAPFADNRDEYNDVSTGMAPVSTFGGEDSTGGAGGSFEKTAWDNVKDVASGVFNSLSETISNRMALKNVSEMEPDELSSFGAYMEKPVTWDDVTDIASLRNPFTVDRSVKNLVSLG